MNIKTKNKPAIKIPEFNKEFLPSLDYLIQHETKTRITLFLSTKSLDFFKRIAKANKISYQGMIRRLVDYYAEKQLNQ